MNKKGQVGLDTARNVMLALLTIGVIAFAIILALGQISDTSVAQTSGSGATNNETLTTVSELGENLAAFSRYDGACIISQVRNQSNYIIISGTQTNINYTLTNSGCTIAYLFEGTGTVNNTGINDTNWLVDYTFTFNEFAPAGRNITVGVTSFFSNATTWFALLAVVVIILIIAIVIFAVNRFGGGGAQTRGNENIL